MKLINIIKNQKKLLSNFSWLAILEVFVLLAPIITYPYLVRVLGRELYGWVITAQITASYCTILIDFGFKRISARHIAINSDNKPKISEVISAILSIRFCLWICSFLIYYLTIILIPSYHKQEILFLLSFITTLSSVFFLDFYFQGIENMRPITIINIFVRGIFIGLTFILIKTPSDYIYVPLLWGIGYVLGGLVSFWIVFINHKIRFKVPNITIFKNHLKEGAIIFFSDAMLSIKDKLNYNIMGALIGMSDIVVYDIGSKISSLMQKPVAIISTVLFPKMAKKPSLTMAKSSITYIFLGTLLVVIIVNIFLPWIVKFFIVEDIDLLAIRLYTLAPLILGISSFIAVNVFYAFGKDKWILKSTYVTSAAYILLLGSMYCIGILNSVFSFVFITIASLIIEAIYRIFLMSKIKN